MLLGKRFARALMGILVLGVIVVLSPVILIVLQEIYGAFINRPFSHCEVMEKGRLEQAVGQGFDVNAGCCAEHMIGECAIARSNSSPLIFAVENENPEAVRLLLEHGADTNQFTESGYALSVAASLGRIDVSKLILTRPTTLESRDVALRMAAHSGSVEIAKLILSSAAPDTIGPSCGSLACTLVTELDQMQNQHVQQQRELLLHLIHTCVDPNTFCDPFRLLSSVARKDEHAPLVKALLERGADLDAKEKSGRTVREFLRSFSDYNSRPQIKALIEQKSE